ncbi:MAG: hypothetical protein K8R85_05805 [Bacteroidetes bacterium]|nr:hypothetical protein [Bacteroidota bacterium]
MSRIPALKKNRDNEIRSKYYQLEDKEVAGKQLYRHEAILEMLSKKFFLAPATIERIVNGNSESTPFVDPNQKTIFDELED